MNKDLELAIKDHADAVRDLRNAIRTKFDELDKNVENLGVAVAVLTELTQSND